MERMATPIPNGVTRAQWFLFGHGMPAGTHASAHTHVWGAALRAINSLTYSLVADGVGFMPRAAVAMAKSAVTDAAAADLQRAHSSAHSLTLRSWAMRWKGLFRPDKRDVTGFASLPGW